MADNVLQGSAFLFDDQGIVFSAQQQKLADNPAMNTLYAGVKPGNAVLQQYATAVATQNYSTKVPYTMVADYLISSAPVSR
ncbi:hypothetical protein, partial [Paraburkholderia sp. SIMBA_053]|uniref:hypothetical protein n=1 Tax=Paraburkholderia sp. SIMBA_053 TaxID=3085794 RepID=UPI00397CB017